MRSFYISLMIVASFMGCKSGQNSDVEMEKLRMERDSLLEASMQKDSAINTFLVSFSEIESNLQNIRARQENLVIQWKGGGELHGSVQERVIDDIKVINELLEENRKKIGTLNRIITSNNVQITELNGTVNLLIQHIKDKNNELVIMNRTLEDKNKELAQRNKVVFKVPR